MDLDGPQTINLGEVILNGTLVINEWMQWSVKNFSELRKRAFGKDNQMTTSVCLSGIRCSNAEVLNQLIY